MRLRFFGRDAEKDHPTFNLFVPRRDLEKTMKAINAMILGAFLLAACNTMDGFGQDVQSGGKKISNEAEQHR